MNKFTHYVVDDKDGLMSRHKSEKSAQSRAAKWNKRWNTTEARVVPSTFKFNNRNGYNIRSC